MGSRTVYLLYGMFMLSFIAMFQYSFSREDHAHIWPFVEHLICFYLLVLIASKRIKRHVLPIMMSSVVLLIINIELIELVGSSPVEFKHFLGRLFVPQAMPVKYGWDPRYFSYSPASGSFAAYRDALLRQSGEFIKVSRLPPQIRQVIGNHTVDIYPWEISYIPANNLHWSPRPVFQSYAAYTPWLDQRNAEFFASPRAPEFILWEQHLESDYWANELASIDGRYLLNDEPLTIMTIMNRYRIIALHPRLALWKRTERPSLGKPYIIREVRGLWNQWSYVPQSTKGILRVKVGFSRPFIGKLKKLFYRENEAFIEYKLRDGQIRKYRIALENMPSGVWVNPLILTLSPTHKGEEVRQIRLTHSSADFFEPALRLQWVLHPFNHSPP
jgi:hypothetical protein